MNALKNGTTLQGGKYRIISTLGQGGFGITYLAENVMLQGKVAIKEFFFKDYCDRSTDTRHVTIPTSGNRDTVLRFRQKFVKEARTIFRLSHPNIVRILDVFEENDTAYYVMEYIEGEPLADMVKRRGAIPEAEALGYIRQAAHALNYIHSQNINHLDVKPGNLIRRRSDGRVLLKDFGVAKQYDAATAEGTTTTPVCISAGYSPAEQYLQKGVQSFSPQIDVYALAATLYKLLTGITPPEAMEVQNDGLPADPLLAKGISAPVRLAIANAMKARTDRSQTIAQFLKDLSTAKRVDETRVSVKLVPPKQSTVSVNVDEPKKKKSYWWLIGAAVVLAAIIGAKVMLLSGKTSNDGSSVDSTAVEYTPKAETFTVNGSSADSMAVEYTPKVETFTVNGVKFDMVEVKGGTFRMGATSEQGRDAESDEKPVHSVTLDSYYIGKTEVTQALWKAVMGSNPSYFKGDNLPVENVIWEDCITFIQELNRITGKNFRLPTEAEWEFSCRGGNNSRGYKYSGSNEIADVAWCEEGDDGSTYPVGTKAPNELGIYDMSGNVWEWCAEWYGSYSSNPQTNPTGPTSGSDRVFRGGSWYLGAGYCRSSNRGFNYPACRNNRLGLRLAL